MRSHGGFLTVQDHPGAGTVFRIHLPAHLGGEAESAPVESSDPPRGHGEMILDRDSYFCSDLICEALVYSDLMNARTSRPSATFPRDLFFGDSWNPYLHFTLPKMNESWDAPARWTGSPIVCTGK